MHNIVQELIMPNMAFGAPDEMYARIFNEGVIPFYNQKKIHFKENGKASFDTFYNSLTIDKWKKETNIKTLNLTLKGTGCFLVRIGIHKLGSAHRWLEEFTFDFSASGNHTASIESWPEISGGMLYFQVEALQESTLTGGYFSTECPKLNSVKLGIVITHFNRKLHVLPAIKRINEELLNDPKWKEHIQLVVVDNSQNITPDEAIGATVIPNKNLGGSGGFSRGLLHLIDQGDFTHCLFMDDDASCEIESIRRTYNLLSFTKNPRTSIAGALLLNNEPWRLLDKGSNFDGYPTCDRANLDMRDIFGLLKSEVSQRKPDFGGWWFLAFEINSVSALSFPFFVKCDDILFGIMNNFPISTLNGIACFSEDFGLKEGPLQRYLDTRGRLVLNLVTGRHNIFKTSLLLSRFCLTPLFSYNYASARAAIMGVNDACRGPEFWEKSLDTTDIRNKIKAFSDTEKLQHVDLESLNVIHPKNKERLTRSIFRIFTLNGFLLPRFTLKNQTVLQPKGFRAEFNKIFRFNRILYYYEPEQIGYIATHNKKQFATLVFLFFISLCKFIVKYRTLKYSYQKNLSSLTSEDFWRKVYE